MELPPPVSSLERRETSIEPSVDDPAGTSIAERVVELRADEVISDYVVRIIQNDFFCPTFSVDGSPVAYTLVNDGAFSIRLDNNTNSPVLAKIEMNGRLFSGEHRILPHGTRTVKAVHERFIATRVELMYNFPIVFDNLLQCEVGPNEVELSSIHETDEFTSLCRVIFLPVRRGLAATRVGCWEIDRSGGVLRVEMQRIGHRALLARVLGVNLKRLIKSQQYASLRPPLQRGRSFQTARNSPLRAASADVRSGRDTPYSSVRRGNSGNGRPLRSGEKSARGSPSPVSFVQFLRSNTSMHSCVSSTSPYFDRRRHLVSSNTPRCTPTEEHSIAASPVSEAIAPASATALLRTPIPSLQQKEPKRQLRRIHTPKPIHPSVSRNSSPAIATNVEGMSKNARRSRGRGSSSSSNGARSSFGGKGGSGAQARRICSSCNALFDRERKMFEDMIDSLRSQLFFYEQQQQQQQQQERENDDGDLSEKGCVLATQIEGRSHLVCVPPGNLHLASTRANGQVRHMETLEMDAGTTTPSLNVSYESSQSPELAENSGSAVYKTMMRTREGFS